MNVTKNDVFTEARDSFLDSLPPKERALFSNCDSPEELIKDLEKFNLKVKNRSRILACMTRVKTFNDALSPYFEVVSIAIQSHPEIAAIAWGTLRLVLQLASNYVTFLEKLANTLESLAKQLPVYTALVDLWTKFSLKPSAQFRSSLGRVYADLFQFYRSVAGMFLKKDGGAKQPVCVVTNLFWKPFDARFRDLLEKIKFHCQLVKDETLVTIYENSTLTISAQAAEYAEAAKDRIRASEVRDVINHTSALTEEMKNSLQQQQRDTTFRNIQKWIRPPEFAQDFEQVQEIREPGTALWIFNHPQFKAWRNIRTECEEPIASTAWKRSLWIHGNPGCGKTILAASAVDELKNNTKEQVCYFFFHSGTRSLETAVASYRALLSQILHASQHDEEVLEMFSFSMWEKSMGQTIASLDQLLDLLLLCAQRVDNQLFIVDGVDECVDSHEFVKGIFKILEGSTIKLLLFSRPDVKHLSKITAKIQRLAIDRSSSQDIRTFCSKKLEDLIEEDVLPSDTNTSGLTSHLVTGADGMFLWTTLMFKYLESDSFTPTQRVHKVMQITLPEGLHDMYLRITDRICGKSGADQQLAKCIITWLTYAQRPLTELELGELRSLRDNIRNSTPDHCEDLSRVVVMVCASLTERVMLLDSRYSEHVPCYRFIHLSAKEYFSLPFSVTRNPLVETGTISPFQIARDCLQYLTFTLPAQPLGGQIGHNVDADMLDHTFPLCNYSTLFWIHHLQGSEFHLQRAYKEERSEASHAAWSELLAALNQFLAQKNALMAWIEASYVFKTPPQSRALQDWSDWAKQRMNSNVPREEEIRKIYADSLCLASQLERIQVEWGAQLMKSPCIIWEEVTDFTSSRLLKANNVQVDSLSVDTLTSAKTSSQYLSKISEATPDGRHVGVLSIWPSELYQKTTSDFISFKSWSKELKEITLGWTARYEVWLNSDPPSRLVDLRISLEQNEIRIQMQQSLQWDSAMTSSAWEMQFPTAISADLKHFTVLRTFYSLPSINEMSNLELKPLLLDLNSNESLGSFWNDDLLSKSKSWRLPPPGTYLYWITLSPDGRYIFFIDNPYVETRPMSLLVYEIHEVGEPRQVLMNSFTTDYVRMPIRGLLQQVSAMFHPEKPLLAFSLLGDTFLWTFNHANVMPHRCLTAEGWGHTVNFSNCGEYVMIKTSSQSLPIIQKIPNEIQDLMPQPVEPSVLPPDSSREASTSLGPINSKEKVGAGSEIVVRNDSAQMTANGTSRGVSILRSSTALDIHLWKQNSDEYTAKSLELTKIPNWPGLDTSTATIWIPKTMDERIQIILNKSAKTWNELSDPIEGRLPAIIRKSPKILNPSKSFIEGTGKRRLELEDEDPKEEDSELQAGLTEGRLTEKLFQSLMVSESEPSKKRSRRDTILQERELDVKDPVVIDMTSE